MKRILGKTRSKLRSKKGETLVEILVAILIIALSAGIFAAMYTASMNTNTASMRIDLTAREQDEAFYAAVGELEKMEKSDKTTTSGGQIKYNNEKNNHSSTVDVEYLTQDGLSVYHNGGSGGSGGGDTP